QEGQPVLLEFGSRRFTPTERRWDTREREAYAIKWALERFKEYVKALPVTVATDHESLRWMDKCENGKVFRWALFIQQFDVEIVHISGQHNVVADWLSRAWDGDG